VCIHYHVLSVFLLETFSANDCYVETGHLIECEGAILYKEDIFVEADTYCRGKCYINNNNNKFFINASYNSLDAFYN